MRILSIDPSVNSVGWATADITEDSAAFNWGVWQVSGLNFLMRCADVRDYILQEIGEFEELVVEWPMFYDSEKGHVAARQGHTINLAGIAMYICGYFQLPHQKMRLYTAPDWKGTVPKQVTARRFFKQFGVDPMKVDHNAVDACMMLLYHCQKEGLVG